MRKTQGDGRGFNKFLSQTHVTTWFTLQTSVLRVDHHNTQVEVWVWEPLKLEYWEFSQCITITETSVLNNFVPITVKIRCPTALNISNFLFLVGWSCVTYYDHRFQSHETVSFSHLHFICVYWFRILSVLTYTMVDIEKKVKISSKSIYVRGGSCVVFNRFKHTFTLASELETKTFTVTFPWQSMQCCALH